MCKTGGASTHRGIRGLRRNGWSCRHLKRYIVIRVPFGYSVFFKLKLSQICKSVILK